MFVNKIGPGYLVLNFSAFQNAVIKYRVNLFPIWVDNSATARLNTEVATDKWVFLAVNVVDSAEECQLDTRCIVAN